ncbi:MAG: NUDIX hydrolase [Methanomicrobiales archaeon]|nr:NUDIX hydrolase [Methanomicrobiales archaeon]
MEVFRGTRLWVERRSITFPDGTIRDRLIAHPGDAVAILPIEGSICHLIRQYRFSVGDTILEAPAGTMEVGECPDETARRELAEEAGLAAGALIPRGFIYTTPGFSDERIYLFEARDLTPTVGVMDEDEVIEPVRVPLSDLGAMIREGRIADAKTICLFCRCLM